MLKWRDHLDDLTHDFAERFDLIDHEERAAIIEHDGHLPRSRADYEAYVRDCKRLGVEPVRQEDLF